MIEIDIPGRGQLRLQYLVLDVNGTLARDGQLLDGVPELLAGLRQQLDIRLLTADTFGRQAAIDAVLGLTATRLQPGGEAAQKSAYVRGLEAAHVAAIGQGANDAEMLQAAALGIAVVGPEGLAVETLLRADVLAGSIHDALNLLVFPTRLTATLRR